MTTCRFFAFVLLYAAIIALPTAPVIPSGTAGDGDSKGASDSGKAAKNTAGQIVSPAGVFNVKKAELTWLEPSRHDGNARITVEFESKPVSETVVFQFDHQLVTLKDRGTGSYSGILRIDTSDFGDVPENASQMDATSSTPPARRLAFDGRHVISEQKAEAARPLRSKSGETIDLLGLPACSADCDPARSLMVTDPSVVNDLTRTYNPITDSGNGNGPWSFGHIMSVLANKSSSTITPEAFTRRWLARWEHDQVVNDFMTEKRSNIKAIVIDHWPRIPGTDELDLAKSPFRLLAIVNRVDLRDNLLFEIPPAARLLDRADTIDGRATFRQPEVPRDSPGGEARMIFGLVDRRQSPPVNLPFTVIFEFGVFLDRCQDVKSWARQWYSLKANPINSAAYRHDLALLTNRFIQPARDPARPTQQFGLNQVRTNEIAFVLPTGFWELREFRVPHEGSEKGHLRQVTVGQTPNNATLGSAEDLNGKPAVANFVNAASNPLLTNTHIVPLQFPPGAAFLGGRSLTLDPAFHWKAPGIANNDARHHFSLNTCNGCHGGETKTPAFVMVSPTETEPGGAAKLAPFLTGVSFPDPVDGQNREFNDLARRKRDLDRLVCLPCFYQIVHRPVRMTH